MKIRNLYFYSLLANLIPLACMFCIYMVVFNDGGFIKDYIFVYLFSAVLNLCFFLLNIKAVYNNRALRFLGFYFPALFYFCFTAYYIIIDWIGGFLHFAEEYVIYVTGGSFFLVNLIIVFLYRKINFIR